MAQAIEKPTAIVIGASAGALGALSVILPELPAGFALPVLIVVHVPPDRNNLMAELLQAKCQIRVCEGEDKDSIRPGVVYLAPPDYHLQVEPSLDISLSNDEAVLFSRPSIDVLFETAADAYGDGLIGVVLTGGNNDGARGLRAIIDAGGRGLVQRPDTAFTTAMPAAALQACPEAEVLSLEEIAAYLKKAGAR
ncbi:MAG: chemotaxis protein CheB [Alphaproteobacteria bacterium]|nr:chemotaxis protein CheB [Alphaproteobacteria bacterium]